MTNPWDAGFDAGMAGMRCPFTKAGSAFHKGWIASLDYRRTIHDRPAEPRNEVFDLRKWLEVTG